MGGSVRLCKKSQTVSIIRTIVNNNYYINNYINNWNIPVQLLQHTDSATCCTSISSVWYFLYYFYDLADVVLARLVNCHFPHINLKHKLSWYALRFVSEILNYVYLVHSRFMCQVSNTAAEQSKDERDVGSNVPAAAAAGRDSFSVVAGRFCSSDVIQQVEEDTERSCDVCVGYGKRDDVIIVTRTLFTQLWAWRHLYWLRRHELTCDHVTTPVPDLTAKIQERVMCISTTWRSSYLYLRAPTIRWAYTIRYDTIACI